MATTASTLPLDPSKPAKYPISISEQLLREDGPRKRRKVNIQCKTRLFYFNEQQLTTVRTVNHRPRLSHSSTKTTVTPSSRGPEHSYNLSLTDENNGNSYLYNGVQQPSDALALIYDSVNGSLTLDKIDSEFNFNLRSTPTNKDGASLAAQYPQLDTGLQEAEEGDEEGLFDENGGSQDPDSEEPDPNNPYDYRHFLKSARPRHSPSPEPSFHGSPMPNHNINSSPIMTSATRPLQPPKPGRRRSHNRPRHLSPNPREEADADNEESEADDVLTIDMGDSATTTNARPWRAALGVLNEPGRGSGPISLRSAASSMSPSLRGDSDVEADRRSNADVEEIDLGDGEIDVDSQEAVGEGVETPGIASEDDEDAFDPFAAELEQGLIAEAMSEAEQEENGGVRLSGEFAQANGVNGEVEQRAVQESSEESEEE